VTIHISLSTESIDRAIRKLEEVKENLEEGLHEVVEILTNEGAEVAQAAYGDWGVQATPITEEAHGEIIVSGDMPLIAEFGAGQATMPVMFENAPMTPVYEGSYSEIEGSQEYYKYGSWHFGGEYFTEVPARHGLLDAKNYIIDNSTNIAQEVIQL